MPQSCIMNQDNAAKLCKLNNIHVNHTVAISVADLCNDTF